MNNMIRLVGAGVILSLSCATAQAATIFLDNFDSEANPGTVAANGAGATGNAPSNWTATAGTIRTVIGGPSGTGNAMFLDGFDGSAVPDTAAVTSASINTAGQTNLTLSFDYFGFMTEGNDTLRLFAAYDGGSFAPLSPLLILGPAGSTGGNPGLAWTTYSLLFANPASTSAKFKFEFITTGGTEYALIDNFSLAGDVSAVPVPAALPLFAGGLGLLGWMARRRRKSEQLA